MRELFVDRGLPDIEEAGPPPFESIQQVHVEPRGRERWPSLRSFFSPVFGGSRLGSVIEAPQPREEELGGGPTANGNPGQRNVGPVEIEDVGPDDGVDGARANPNPAPQEEWFEVNTTSSDEETGQASTTQASIHARRDGHTTTVDVGRAASSGADRDTGREGLMKSLVRFSASRLLPTAAALASMRTGMGARSKSFSSL